MMRAEFLSFFQIDDLMTLLLLNKATNHLVKEHFFDSQLSIDQIIELLGSGVRSIRQEDLDKLVNEEEKKEESKGP